MSIEKRLKMRKKWIVLDSIILRGGESNDKSKASHLMVPISFYSTSLAEIEMLSWCRRCIRCRGTKSPRSPVVLFLSMSGHDVLSPAMTRIFGILEGKLVALTPDLDGIKCQ